jgi:hypothetical protein
VNEELCRGAIARFANGKLEESGINDSVLEIISTMCCKGAMILSHSPLVKQEIVPKEHEEGNFRNPNFMLEDEG